MRAGDCGPAGLAAAAFGHGTTSGCNGTPASTSSVDDVTVEHHDGRLHRHHVLRDAGTDAEELRHGRVHCRTVVASRSLHLGAGAGVRPAVRRTGPGPGARAGQVAPAPTGVPAAFGRRGRQGRSGGATEQLGDSRRHRVGQCRGLSRSRRRQPGEAAQGQRPREPGQVRARGLVCHPPLLRRVTSHECQTTGSARRATPTEGQSFRYAAWPATRHTAQQVAMKRWSTRCRTPVQPPAPARRCRGTSARSRGRPGAAAGANP